jgi:hypothetical protein
MSSSTSDRRAGRNKLSSLKKILTKEGIAF